MDFKKTKKKFSYFIGWLLLTIFSAIIRKTPWQYLYVLSRHMGLLGYSMAGRQRKIALDSLTTAFGNQKPPEEIRKIAQDCFIYMIKSGVEVIYMTERPDFLKQRMQLVGKEIIEQALARGKGVILVSAHFGNFPVMLARLSVEGYKVAAIMRPMKDAKVEKLFLRNREKLNINTIYSQPRKTCVENSIRALRENSLLFIPLDQNFGTAGVFVDFFGRKAATATGPVVFAQRTGAALIPCFIIRQKDDTHTIVFEPALRLEEGKTEQETIEINVQKITSIIETYIRQYPAEWSWIHRRWKSKMQEPV
ncbi:MAG: lysophospholipid acyltransferase family protein [Candidatus Omnitrophota bacterium]|jgi:KDO2-lipid IV(A) lauroyltransferase